jgi:TfoX/Sxy family transcriptional regulator of competence genes
LWGNRALRLRQNRPMAYDEQLAARVRGVLADVDGVGERKMFGGIAFMQHGNMVCGVIGNTLMLRLGAERADAALDEPHTRPMDFTGRPMKGMVYVDPPGCATEAALAGWVRRALAFAATLPPKR